MLFESIYIEEEVQNHPLVKEICHRFSNLEKISCKNYGEIFNRKQQNFRLQKQNSSLILAKKYGNFVHETPKNFGIGGKHNYYFSHMYNCLYDCRYCFLQGMYASAHYVLFVNFEDFQYAIVEIAKKFSNEDCYFFSGYDCDSLALEQVTHFAKRFVPIFENLPQAYLELRTKSNAIAHLLDRQPIPNCIVAYTLSPEVIAQSLEHRAPPLQRRIEALQKLQSRGWNIGIRFDPLIYCEGYQNIYSQFFQKVFENLNLDLIHSSTLGILRFPREIYKKIHHLYPQEKLFSLGIQEKGKMVSYSREKEEEIVAFCKNEIVKYFPESKLFHCKD